MLFSKNLVRFGMSALAACVLIASVPAEAGVKDRIENRKERREMRREHRKERRESRRENRKERRQRIKNKLTYAPIKSAILKA